MQTNNSALVLLRGGGDLATGVALRLYHAGINVIIAPLAIVGAAHVLRPGTRIPRLARVRIVIGPPIDVERADPTIPATRELTGRVRDAVRAMSIS